jgi:hypothetical protein
MQEASSVANSEYAHVIMAERSKLVVDKELKHIYSELV